MLKHVLEKKAFVSSVCPPLQYELARKIIIIKH